MSRSTMAPSDKVRAFPRSEIHLALRVDSGTRRDRAGMTRNVSAGGCLFHSRSRFELGDRLELTFIGPPGTEPPQNRDERVTGRVVRVTEDDAPTPFPHVMAVQFDEPIPLDQWTALPLPAR